MTDPSAPPSTASAARTPAVADSDVPGRWQHLLGRWWVRVLLVTLAARLVSAVIFVLVARTQAANPWTDAAPGYWQYTGLMWDASWYREIAEQGYPADLPVGADGQVLQNAWAFFPLFPALVRGLMALTGGSWTLLAPLTSLVLGTVAMLVVHQVVADAVGAPHAEPLPERVRRGAPLLTVALLSTSASAPVLQVGYTEALALLGVAVALWALQREQYLVAATAVAALGFTRAVALPLAVVALAHGIARWRSGRAFPWRSRLAVAGVAGVAVVSGFAWPAIVGRATGVADAYLLTQGAWRGRGEVVPLLPWVDVAQWWLGSWGVPVLGLTTALLVIGLASRPLRRLGVVAWGWTVAYSGYLIGVLEPGTSLVRFALLAFPAWGALACVVLPSRRPRAWSVVLVVAGLVGQVAWIALLWRLVPPSGWPP
ncbi:hypothetical protein OEB99_04060 [Actinotalea sp. M2MS4P-6]|uniref:hypothetical protein n=1 Tax=Actinotalea sp. M2MS4P-6 TaxID=2983762 RepID=UPI0021E4292F|nr:hypothetical protein [Actinotalea sp. M2MS4P-6]MCV2393473.1 hypothetical protein [Actinotalea sp. M2MS4P-6]